MDTLSGGTAADRHAPGNADALRARFGLVVPILGASGGVGVSVVAAALSDALQLAGYSVLLADTAGPIRSGLGQAARADGPVVRVPEPTARVRFSWRAQALVGRVEDPGRSRSVAPSFWWLPGDRRVQATVVDVAGDAWELASDVRLGTGRWLSLAACPLLVLRPTVPGLVQAEQVLARLEPWVLRRMIPPIGRLVVVGARRWPPRVAATAGYRVSALLESAVFVPYERDIATAGITGDVTPDKIRSALSPLLRQWRVTGWLPTPPPDRKPL
ncbi:MULTISPECIES: hypothetical protein [Amycolatopsis]|uniref:hypothetical protein n=1 Tax=Amycolatopsis TaxID=1813 RepID=UPI0007DF042A|nr:MULTISPECIES: hypothetical protein [Amycolatopsis]OAP24187.1 hypothetical protein A4R44_04960 [Amycolatopsis sp. M39]